MSNCINPIGRVASENHRLPIDWHIVVPSYLCGQINKHILNCLRLGEIIQIQIKAFPESQARRIGGGWGDNSILLGSHWTNMRVPCWSCVLLMCVQWSSTCSVMTGWHLPHVLSVSLSPRLLWPVYIVFWHSWPACAAYSKVHWDITLLYTHIIKYYIPWANSWLNYIHVNYFCNLV